MEKLRKVLKEAAVDNQTRVLAGELFDYVKDELLTSVDNVMEVAMESLQEEGKIKDGNTADTLNKMIGPVVVNYLRKMQYRF
jgi:hypothetical protein